MSICLLHGSSIKPQLVFKDNKHQVGLSVEQFYRGHTTKVTCTASWGSGPTSAIPSDLAGAFMLVEALQNPAGNGATSSNSFAGLDSTGRPAAASSGPSQEAGATAQLVQQNLEIASPGGASMHGTAPPSLLHVSCWGLAFRQASGVASSSSSDDATGAARSAAPQAGVDLELAKRCIDAAEHMHACSGQAEEALQAEDAPAAIATLRVHH